jgi:hypothetical protein
MSWNAVRRATDADVPSPIMKLILILLVNKADDSFLCYPSILTLMAESCAGRSTVLRALKDMQVNSFLIGIAQFHESRGRRSGRYFLNHPDAPRPSGEHDERI